MILRIVFVVCCFLFFVPISAQLKNRIELGVGFTPNYDFRTINYSGANEWQGEIRDDQELPKFGYTAGFIVVYHAGRNIELQSGVQWTNHGERTRKQALTWSDGSVGGPVSTRSVRHYQFVSLPLRVNYRFNRRRLSWHAGGGIIINRFISKRTTVITEYSDGDIDRRNSSQWLAYRNVHLGILLAGGFKYQLNNKFALAVEPTVTRAITSAGGDNDAKVYFHSFGLNTSLRLSLRAKRTSPN